MEGYVFGLHALINIPFRIAGQPDIEIEFVIDTGFAGFLTLPSPAVSALHLPFDRLLTASLGDGSSIQANVHTATIVWKGVERDVEVLATGRQPLLGTLMLKQHNLDIDFVDGGGVRINFLP